MEYKRRKELNAYSLAGIGIGGVIGAGFFLGSNLAIKEAGPSIILAFILGGFIMAQVLGSMTSITINRPVQGSFRVYTDKYLGRTMGFYLGWTIFVSSILILASEAIATGIFFSYWVPSIPPSLFALFSLLLIIFINRLSVRLFSYVESFMSIFKIVMMIIFIFIGLFFIINNHDSINFNNFGNFSSIFPNGLLGFLRSMLIVIFTYGGISTVAMAAYEVKNPHKEIPKATIIMTIGIVLLYIVSMLIIILIIDWSTIDTLVSPFVQVFDKMNYGFGQDFINVTILIATLSVMIGAYYGSLQMLVSLSSAKEAKKALSMKNSKGFYFNAWITTGISVFLFVLSSFIIGPKLFNYLISASTYFAFFNWIINLWTYIVWYKKKDASEKYLSPLIKGPSMAIVTIIIIIILTIFSLSVADFRIGFYSAVVMTIFISMYYKMIEAKRN